MGKPLRLLMVEDSEEDALLTILALKKGGYDPVYERVEDAGAMRKALLEKSWDVILCDYQMPQFNGPAAIAILKETGIDIPLIIVSGAIGEETAVECMRLGACDYVMKSNLPRLVPAIERELKEAESRLQRKQAEDALIESEEKYRWVLDNIADVITVMDMNLRFTYVSPSIMHMRGYTAEEAVAQTFEQVMTPESLQISAKVFEEEMTLEASGTADPDRIRILEVEQYRKDGSIVLMENHLSFMRDEAMKPVGIISVSRDITERKRAEEALQRSTEEALQLAKENKIVADIGRIISSTINIETIYKAFSEKVMELIPFDRIVINLIDPEKNVVSCQYQEGIFVSGRQGGNILPSEGTVTAQIIRTGIGFIIQLESADEMGEKYPGLLPELQHGIRSFLTVPLISKEHVIGALALRSTKSGAYTNRDLMLAENIANHIAGAISNAQLFIERKRAESQREAAIEALRESEEKYRTILENIEDGYYEIDIAGNLTFFNDSVCRILGNTRAELMGMNNRQYTDKENSQRLYQALNKVFRTGEPSKGVDYEIIGKDGTKLYIESSVSLIRNASGQPIGFRGIMRNITERKRTEEQLKQTLESLRKAVGTTIQVMVSAVESRDPYTAGHQNRSADLARAIATEMGLSQDTIEAIRMAGPIHDIGKLSVPAEILSKPGKLSAIEFSLVKEHARTGFEILKNVESPWPLAQIVYQHHERMDGSGYPRKLKGEEILIEARIMAVADVVESMASHRPYRPALGINAALEEIEKNKGILYDDAVADACLRLFRENKYKLDGNTLAR